VPGDKSISHRALLFGAIAEGETRIEGLLPAEDPLSTAACLRAMGVTVSEIRAGEPVTVQGVGLDGFQEPADVLDCGNSGTTMRLMLGLLAGRVGRHFVLTGDASLRGRPMRRVGAPLAAMGAVIHGRKDGNFAPLAVLGQPLQGTTIQTPVASAQVKSAILLAGLSAEGETSVTEPAACRDHTERMLQEFGVALDLGEADANGRRRIALKGPQQLKARDFAVPGDISSAAFWLVAGAAKEGSEITMHGVGLNPTRDGIISVLLRMGADITTTLSDPKAAEPSGTIVVKGGKLTGTIIAGAEIPNVIDELPVLAVAGALAQGKTIIRDAKELRVKETDRIAAVAGNLRAMGAKVTETEDGMEIEGGHPLHGATLQCFHDHRIAMAFAIAGLFASGETVIEKVECVATSYPTFGATLESVLKG
jgi:3-phosphoshikimate 1-carboxyvinyltransferase